MEPTPEEAKPTEVKSFLDEVAKEGDNVSFDNTGESPAESSPEKEEVVTPPAVEAKQTDDVPFHRHPRFKALVDEKNELKDQLTKAVGKLDDMSNKQIDSNEPIPSWFSTLYGDNKPAWEAYKHHDSQQREAMKADILKEMSGKEQEQKDQAKYWDNWVASQLNDLEDEGKKFDKNKLLSLMEEYKPTDQNGNLDFHKGIALYEKLEANEKASKDSKDTARKEIAAQTTSSGKGDTPKSTVNMKDIRRNTFHELVQD